MNIIKLSVFLSAIASVHAQERQCVKAPEVFFTNYSTEYDPDSRILSLDVKGRTLVTQAGYSATRNAQFILNIVVFSDVYYQAKIVEACDLFPVCPFPPGNFTLKKTIKLPIQIPFADLHAKLLYNSEKSTAPVTGCTTTRLEQTSASYFPVILWVSLVVALLALMSGVLANFWSDNPSLLTFLKGEGNSTRSPGFFDVWEYAQFVIATGVLANKSPPWYRAFTTCFRWSFFDWGIPFINDLAPLENHLPANSTESWIGFKSYEDAVDSPSGGLFARVSVTVGICAMTITLITIIVTTYFFATGSSSKDKGEKSTDALTLDKIQNISIGSLHRLFHMCFFPLAMVSLYGFTLGGISATVMVISSLLVSFMIIVLVYLLYQVLTTKPLIAVFIEDAILLKFGPLYNTFKVRMLKYSAFPMARRLIYAIVLGLLQASGMAQVLILAATEAIFMITVGFSQPYYANYVNRLGFILCATRIGCLVLVLVQVPELGLGTSGREGTSFGLIIIHLLIMLCMLLSILWNLYTVVKRKIKKKYSENGENTIMEKGDRNGLSLESFELEDDGGFGSIPPSAMGYISIPKTREVPAFISDSAKKRASFDSQGSKGGIPPGTRKRIFSDGAISITTSGLAPEPMDTVNLTPFPSSSRESKTSDNVFVPTLGKEGDVDSNLSDTRKWSGSIPGFFRQKQ